MYHVLYVYTCVYIYIYIYIYFTVYHKLYVLCTFKYIYYVAVVVLCGVIYYNILEHMLI